MILASANFYEIRVKPGKLSTMSLIEKDYIQDLPAEVYLRIFSYFTPYELCQQIGPVCKLWYGLAKDSSLWKELALPMKPNVSTKIYYDILIRCKWLKSLVVTTKKQFRSLLDCSVSLTNLKDLDLGACRFLNAILFSKLVSKFPQIDILKLGSLVDIHGVRHIVNLVNLSSLTFSYMCCDDLSDKCIAMIGLKCQKLEELTIAGSNCITDEAIWKLAIYRNSTLRRLYLRCENLTDHSMLYLRTCTKLTSLNLENGYDFTDTSLEAISTLSNLTEINITKSNELSEDGFSRFFSSATLASLRSIELFDLQIDDTGMENIARNCKDLRDLRVYGCWQVSEKGLQAVIDNCSLLSVLFLVDFSRLTGESFVDIPSKLPNLTTLYLKRCYKLIPSTLRNLAKEVPHLKISHLVGYEL